MAGGDPAASAGNAQPAHERVLGRVGRWFASLVPGRWIEEDERKAEVWKIRFDFARTVLIGLATAVIAALFGLQDALVEVSDRRQRAASKVVPELDVWVNEICPRGGGARFEVVVNVRATNEGIHDVAVKRLGLAIELLGVPRAAAAANTITLPEEPLHAMWGRGEHSRLEFAEVRCDQSFAGGERAVPVDCRGWAPDGSGECVVEYRHCRERDFPMSARYGRDQGFGDSARYIIQVPEEDHHRYLYYADVVAVVEWCEVQTGVLGWRERTSCTSDLGGSDHWSLQKIAPLHELAGLDGHFCRE